MTETFGVPLEAVQEKLHKLHDVLHPSMPDRHAMPISEGLLVVQELWKTPKSILAPSKGAGKCVKSLPRNLSTSICI